MLKFCNDNKGAISVFLTLILLPTLLLGGLTTDAARIYASKVVISDAGEMAMNAALARYDLPLLDEYGLFAMEETPSSMTDDLQKCFDASLNGTGLVKEDYDKILDLVTEQFEVINLEASKLYQTDVEKQQIVEYMKYRAPVCLTEVLLKKLELLKETDKITKATEAQLDFAEAMADCQDAMEAAKKALDELNEVLQKYPSQAKINEDLGNMEFTYRDTLAKALLMYEAGREYTKTVDMDGIEAANSFVKAAEKINLNNPLDEDTFENYLNAKYFRASAKKLPNIVKEKEKEEPDPANTVLHTQWEREMAELHNLQNSFNDANNIVQHEYLPAVKTIVMECINTHSNIVQSYYNDTNDGITKAQKALEELQNVQRKLADAKDKWGKWEQATSEIDGNSEPIKDAKAGMEGSVKEYEAFFGSSDSNPEGNERNLDDLANLIELVDTDKQYYQEIKSILEGITYHDVVIVSTDSLTQCIQYQNKAATLTDGETDYSKIVEIKPVFAAEYKVAKPVETTVAMYQISSDPFYLRLIEYCKTKTDGDAEEKKKDAKERLDKGKEGQDDANKEDGYPDYQWEKTDNLPSVLLAKTEKSGDSLEISMSGEADVGRNKRKALKEAKDSISAASSFLEGLDSIISKGATNLYVAEYAMQMFSYYTANKQVIDGKVQTIPDDQVISLSGHVMSDRPAYRAEIEYILWGNENSQTNIRNTVMSIFGIRLLLNSIFAFTNGEIYKFANGAATTIAGSAPYLIPIIQAVIQFACSCMETTDDIERIKEGYGVAVLKAPDTWKTFLTNEGKPGDNTKGDFTLDYSEYLRIFLNLNMLNDNLEATKLARIADCIQLDTEMDITKAYTMLSIHSKVKARTTFMKKISDEESGGWLSADENYYITYQSVLGY